MASRRNEVHSGSSSRADDGAPRRRGVPIEDLLNPYVEERKISPSYLAPARALSSDTNSMNTSYRNQSSSMLSGQRVAHWRAHRSPRRSPPRPSSSKYPGARREFRPTYSEEETLFIWYHRIDLGYDWQDITHAYNRQFPERAREGPGGIQCRYYRCCSDNNIPKVRERRRSASSAEEYGMRARTGLWYPWMKN